METSEDRLPRTIFIDRAFPGNDSLSLKFTPVYDLGGLPRFILLIGMLCKDAIRFHNVSTFILMKSIG
jgi:hypothetical protein